MQRPISSYFLYLLLFALCSTSLVCSVFMIAKPDGSILLLDVNNLQRTPFKDYLVPGLILLLCGGIFPLLALIGLLFKFHWKIFDALNLYKNMHGAWAYSIYSGVMIIIWIVVQQFTMPYLWLQPLYILLGLFIIIFSLTPANIRFYKKINNP